MMKKEEKGSSTYWRRISTGPKGKVTQNLSTALCFSCERDERNIFLEKRNRMRGLGLEVGFWKWP